MAHLVAILALAWLPSVVGGQDNGGERLLIRHIDANGNRIVFSYAGDIWSVPSDGGQAERLTRGPADDDFPVLSPDGFHIAFSRREAGGHDIFVIPVQGGEARRLTWNPAPDIARGWRPDGSGVLFTSRRDADGIFRLYTVGPDGGLPEPLPLPRAWDGSFVAAGTRLAYVPHAPPGDLSGAEWRRYRGGRMSHIELALLTTSETYATVPGEGGNDRNPMWVDRFIYFISDRDGTANLYAYNPVSGSLQQLTSYREYGVDDAAASGARVVLLQDGRLRSLDPTTGRITTIEVEVAPNRAQLAPRTVDGSRYVLSATPSPSGERVILGVRGDVVLFDVETGTWENLTRSPGSAERYPAMSPDGRWVAYFSDATGDYQLIIHPLEGEDEPRQVPVELRSSFYQELIWSPNSKHIAFSDKRLRLWVVDVETGGARRIATADYSFQDRYQPAWSPDGAWLAYSKYEDNQLRAIYLYSIERGRQRRITHGRVSAEHPTFDTGGQHLYFVASSLASLGEFGGDVLTALLLRPFVARSLQVVPLREGAGSPMAGAPAGPADAPSGQPVRRGPPQRPDLQIDLSGLENRVVSLPLADRDYAALAAGGPGVLYALVTEWPPSPTFGTEPTRTLYRYDSSNPADLTRVADRVDEFSLSADGSTILYRSGDRWALLAVDTAGDDVGELELESLRLEVDPASEWRQIYHEAWRLMDDYFYDPNHHGYNLSELENHYAEYLPTVVRRQDLNLLLSKALAHVSVGGVEVSGGDLTLPDAEVPGVGLLGADYTTVGSHYRIVNILRSGHFASTNPLTRAPLDGPGVGVRENDYLLSVDGEEVTAERNVHSYFVGKALDRVTIRVASDTSGTRARSYTVVPLPDEGALRRWNWVERNRLRVEEESQGILGYVYVPDWNVDGIVDIFRQLLESRDRRGLIIDQRFAEGGVIADFMIDFLARQPLFYHMFRQGDDLPVPINPMPRAKVLLINDANVSAAEVFALMFKEAGLGKVLGTRTGGSGAGPYVHIPPLIDGGRVAIPTRAPFDPDGSWVIENAGVEPDTAIAWPAAEWRAGRDPQLQEAIQTVLRMIVEHPPIEVERPPYPDYTRPTQSEGGVEN